MNSKNPLVSILIVTFNAQKFIEKTVISCLNQTYPNIEILILDNASTDNTSKLLKKFKQPLIKLFFNESNTGPYVGLNFLIDQAKGKYIAIQDHDDVWLPSKISLQVKYLNKHPNEIACGTSVYSFYESKNTLIRDLKTGYLSYVSHTSLLFRNQNYHYHSNLLLPDEYFEKITLQGLKNKIYCLSEPLSIHRIRGDQHNLSKTRFSFSFKNILWYLSINGYRPKTLKDLLGIFVTKYFPESLEWFIISKIYKRKSKQMTLNNFIKLYPNISL